MVSQNFIFFKGASVAGVSNVFTVNNNDGMTLEVSGTGTYTIEIQARVDTENSTNWTPIGAINTKDFATSSSISSNGIYSFGISGLSLVRCEIKSITGTANVLGRITY